MVAERAADIIKGELLPAEKGATYWRAKNWETEQRHVSGSAAQ